MKTVSEIRRTNLERLIQELESLDAVAFAAGTSSIYLSQVRHQAIDQKTGKTRQMGSAMARRLDKGAGKPEGWMDQVHTTEASPTQTAQPPQEYQQNKAFELLQQAQPATNSIATLAQITAALSRHFETMDANTRKMAVGLLGQLADDPKDHARIAAMIEFSIHSKHQKLA